jgi:hypothetical protein
VGVKAAGEVEEGGDKGMATEYRDAPRTKIPQQR